MSQTSLESEPQQQAYRASFHERQQALLRQEPEWLSALRQEAMDAFADHGFPTPQDEEWRYTSVAPITRIPFRPARPDSIHCAVELIQGTHWAEPAAA
ncbi:MAG TPA: hypothetical protein VNN17_02805, partial [Terriglobia bacterium]|nr:hypothetical protein [Terriglobia bacterium]